MPRNTLRLHLLRHGQTASSRDQLFCGAGSDPGLTDEGAEMARAFAAAYGLRPWTAVYSSPLLRASQTAEPLCAAAGIAVRVRAGLAELSYGAWEGQTVAAVERDHAADYAAWLANPVLAPPPGGESAAAVAARALAVLSETLSDRLEGDVLMVSHKGTIRMLLCVLLGLDLSRYRQRLDCPVASLSVVELATEGPRLMTLGDRGHLDARLRGLPGS